MGFSIASTIIAQTMLRDLLATSKVTLPALTDVTLVRTHSRSYRGPSCRSPGRSLDPLCPGIALTVALTHHATAGSARDGSTARAKHGGHINRKTFTVA